MGQLLGFWRRLKVDRAQRQLNLVYALLVVLDTRVRFHHFQIEPASAVLGTGGDEADLDREILHFENRWAARRQTFGLRLQQFPGNGLDQSADR